MKKVLLIVMIFSLIIFSVYADNITNKQRKITGNVSIKTINPTDTVLAVCASNEKYVMEAGDTLLIRLYIRNSMKNKTVKRLYLDIVPVEGFNFSYTPEYLSNLTTIPGEEVIYFDIFATADKNIPKGNYRVDFFIGTDEYMTGAFTDEIMIKIRNYGNELIYIYAVSIIIISIAFIIRFFWVYNVNKKITSVHPKKNKSKTISQKYYKATGKKTKNRRKIQRKKK